MRYSDFSRTIYEVVLCSSKPPNVFERRLGVRGDTVTLYLNFGLTSWTTLDEIVRDKRKDMRREYRGPVEIDKGVDDHCPYCRNALIYECLNCGFLWCCPAEELQHRCDWCKATGPVHVPLGPRVPYEPYEPPSFGSGIWGLWLDFNEWIYDLFTRKARPESLHKAADEFRRGNKK